jgi:Acyl-coenzyme A synthetases/AMP-(fatty) acid ligases
MSDSTINSLLHEDRRFEPHADFVAGRIASPELYDQAQSDRLGFWAEQSRSLLHWHRPFSETLDWSNPPFAKWFADGTLNVAYNCLDHHVAEGRGDRVALPN